MRAFCRRVFCALFALAAVAAVCPPPAEAGQQGDQPLFRSTVDLVSVAAIVRDKRGRIVRSLTREDFRLFDIGEPRQIVSFGADTQAPASVTILVDGSGSMAAGTDGARHVAELLLAQLTSERDEAALMSFDTRLLTLRDFTSDFDRIRRGLHALDAFGASSIYDAIAGTAGMVAGRPAQRRAVLVITDGSDNASEYTAPAVAWIASAIDVPVYVFAVGHDVPRATDHARTRLSTPLMDLARATGGDFFFAGNAEDQELAVGRVIDELRHQYLIAFEPSTHDGLHRLEIRTRDPHLKVRSRQWYAAGASD